jgi:hypothetical protein
MKKRNGGIEFAFAEIRRILAKTKWHIDFFAIICQNSLLKLNETELKGSVNIVLGKILLN